MSSLGGFANQVSSDNGKGAPPPDKTISKLEDDLVKTLNSGSLTGKMAGLKISEGAFPTRPAYGTRGAEVVLWTNSFALQIKTTPFCKYTLEVERVPTEGAKSTANPPKTKGAKSAVHPTEVKGRKLARLVELALQKVRGSVKAVTEFKSQVVSLEPLAFPDASQSVEVLYTDEGRETPFRVKFNGPGHVDVGGLIAYLGSMKTAE